MEIIANYEAVLERAKADHQRFLEQLIDAGPEGAGPIKNRIKDLERFIEGNETTLILLKAKINGTLEETRKEIDCKLFIISGSVDRVKKTLTEDYFKFLHTPLHRITPGEWMPFSNEQFQIQEFLEELKKKGYQFTDYYLEGIIDAATVELIQNQQEKNIAIIDLLCLDTDNSMTALRFDRNENAAVLIPICMFLDNEVKKFMLTKRASVFRYLENSYIRIPSCHLNVPSRLDFEREITAALTKKNPVATMIADVDIRPHTYGLRPGF